MNFRERTHTGDPLLVWQGLSDGGKTDCVGCKDENWETPADELEQEPEYQHLLAVCKELGLEI
jgi:hypothetical protein